MADLSSEYQKHYALGWRYLNKVIALAGGRRRRLWWLGRSRARKAIAEFRVCVDMDSASWQCMWAIGKAHQALYELGQALQWMEKACAIETGNPDVFRETAIEAMTIGLGEKAVKYASLALKLNDKDSGLHANYALALLIHGKGDEASKAIIAACELDPVDAINKSVKRMIDRVLSRQQPWPKRIAM